MRGRIANETAAALIGAPRPTTTTAASAGARAISRAGASKLRNLLYMSVMGPATQHNPVLMAYYQRLRARGKEAKVALIACMRKLIIILNTMLARDETWNNRLEPQHEAPTAWMRKSPVSGRGQRRSRRRRGRAAPACVPGMSGVLGVEVSCAT